MISLSLRGEKLRVEGKLPHHVDKRQETLREEVQREGNAGERQTFVAFHLLGLSSQVGFYPDTLQLCLTQMRAGLLSSLV